MTTAAEKRHLDKVAGLGCVLCRVVLRIQDSPAEIHHPRTGTGAGRKASHMDAIGLCPTHHRLGNDAVHVMGRKAWERHHGITERELMQVTKNLIGGAQ